VRNRKKTVQIHLKRERERDKIWKVDDLFISLSTYHCHNECLSCDSTGFPNNMYKLFNLFQSWHYWSKIIITMEQWVEFFVEDVVDVITNKTTKRKCNMQFVIVFLSFRLSCCFLFLFWLLFLLLPELKFPCPIILMMLQNFATIFLSERFPEIVIDWVRVERFRNKWNSTKFIPIEKRKDMSDQFWKRPHRTCRQTMTKQRLTKKKKTKNKNKNNNNNNNNNRHHLPNEVGSNSNWIVLSNSCSNRRWTWAATLFERKRFVKWRWMRKSSLSLQHRAQLFAFLSCEHTYVLVDPF
jgi:hypothetical protein